MTETEFVKHVTDVEGWSHYYATDVWDGRKVSDMFLIEKIQKTTEFEPVPVRKKMVMSEKLTEDLVRSDL